MKESGVYRKIPPEDKIIKTLKQSKRSMSIMDLLVDSELGVSGEMYKIVRRMARLGILKKERCNCNKNDIYSIN